MENEIFFAYFGKYAFHFADYFVFVIFLKCACAFGFFFSRIFHAIESLKNALVSHSVVIKSPIRALDEEKAEKKRNYYHWLECAT